MLFKASFPLLEIHYVIAWLVLLFQLVIFFTENSRHQKQSRKGVRMDALSFFGHGWLCNNASQCLTGLAGAVLCL
jgi:hypothetical protein